MKPLFGKIMRFVLNFVFFMIVLISATYYVYSTPAELFGIKNVLLPLNAVLLLSVVIALILAIINEVTTVFIVRMIGRKKP